MTLRASTVAYLVTILCAADHMDIWAKTAWDDDGLWFAEWETALEGPLHRDLILDGARATTKPDMDV